MNLYLMRHGEATNEPGNPLSSKGRRDAATMAGFLAERGIGAAAIAHSTKLRAQQTAHILAEKLQPAGGVVEMEGVAPLDDPKAWAAQVQDQVDSLLLVSHLPFLPKLFSILVCGYTDDSIVAMPTATLICLVREGGLWSLRWMVTPDLLHSRSADDTVLVC
jgi:phosphohistidine phosphatase SixA